MRMIARLQRRDAVERPALGVALDAPVEVLAVVLGRVGERAGEGRRVALEEVVELAPGDVVLVEREDGGAALVGAAGHAARTLAAGRPFSPRPWRLRTSRRWSHLRGEPGHPARRCLQARGPHAIADLTAVAGALDQPGAVEDGQVLDDRHAADRQLAGQRRGGPLAALGEQVEHAPARSGRPGRP
jgi:hypothetical protein